MVHLIDKIIERVLTKSQQPIPILDDPSILDTSVNPNTNDGHGIGSDLSALHCRIHWKCAADHHKLLTMIVAKIIHLTILVHCFLTTLLLFQSGNCSSSRSCGNSTSR